MDPLRRIKLTETNGEGHIDLDLFDDTISHRHQSSTTALEIDDAHHQRHVHRTGDIIERIGEQRRWLISQPHVVEVIPLAAPRTDTLGRILHGATGATFRGREAQIPLTLPE